MMIEEWSFDLILPSIRLETLDELSMADYDALTEATKDVQNSLFPSLTDSPANEADPKAPTAS
jgi:hypothetical protein